MTRDTFVSGEAATVAPLGRGRLGSMYLPPNSGTNTAFLETLRLALVHERPTAARRSDRARSRVFATPRAWLREGSDDPRDGRADELRAGVVLLSRRGDIVQVATRRSAGADASAPPPSSRAASALSPGRDVRTPVSRSTPPPGRSEFPPGARRTLELVVGLGPECDASPTSSARRAAAPRHAPSAPPHRSGRRTRAPRCPRARCRARR